jgi:hypothetical protein
VKVTGSFAATPKRRLARRRIRASKATTPFFQEVIAHPLPNDLEAVKLLVGSSAVLDLYMSSAIPFDV